MCGGGGGDSVTGGAMRQVQANPEGFFGPDRFWNGVNGDQATPTTSGGTRAPPAPDMNTGTPGTDQPTTGTRVNRTQSGSGLATGASDPANQGRTNKGSGLRM